MVTTVDTWDLNPEFPVELAPSALDHITSPSQGTIQHQDIQTSVSVNTDEPETLAWILRWEHADLDDWDRLVEMWETSARGTLPIAFTPPGGSSVPVYIVENPRMVYAAPKTCRFTVKLEEATNQ